MGVDRANQHQLSSAANRGAVENTNVRTLLDRVTSQSTDVTKISKKSEIGKDKGLFSADHDTQIMSKALSSLANMGALEGFLDPLKVKSRKNRENEEIKEKWWDNDDKSELSKKASSSGHAAQFAKGFKKGNIGRFAEMLDSEGRDLLNEYENLYSKSLISQNDPHIRSQIKKRLDEVEAKLRDKGMNSDGLRDIGAQIRGSAKQEISQLIKEAFLKKLTTPTKTIEWAISEKNLSSILELAMFNPKLGANFGGASIQEIIENAKSDAMQQISSTILNEFEKDLVRDGVRAKSQIGGKDLKAFIDMAMKAGVDLAGWSKAWENKKWDLGLQELPENVTEKIAEEKKNNTEYSDDQNQNKKDQKDDGPDLTPDDKEVLFDQYRDILTTRLIDDSIKTRFSTAFGMRKLDWKLKKMGVMPADLQRLREEAKGLARIKLISLLKTAYLERVVLLAESGARVKVSSRRISKLKEKLYKLGVELTEDELAKIRHEAEFTVYNNAVAKLSALKVREINGGKNAEIEQERVYLTKVMTTIERRWQYDESIAKSELRKGNVMKRIFGRMGAFRRIDGQV